MDQDRFSADYYKRYYVDTATRVTERETAERLARYVCAFLEYHELPVRRVLDLGCGMGYWREPVLEIFKDASWTGVELSSWLCERYGWTNRSILSYRPRGRFDLVVCQDVLQYLDATGAEEAIDRLGRWCRGVLYFDALTTQDWRDNVDRERTDADVYLRAGDWYRRRLAERFQFVGAGIHVHKDAEIVLFELEKAK